MKRFLLPQPSWNQRERGRAKRDGEHTRPRVFLSAPSPKTSTSGPCLLTHRRTSAATTLDTSPPPVQSSLPRTGSLPLRSSKACSSFANLLLFALACAAVPLLGAGHGEYYTVENVPTPANVVDECGGISFLPDGRLAAVFHHGEVYLYDPAAKAWKLFGEGLHDPMGVYAVSPSEILVAQRAELTRLRDTDADGVADKYECLTDAWGISGNYHEFASGIVRDRAGNLFVAVSNGSSGSVARYEVRGKFKPEGYVLTSHFSCVPYRGWIVKIAPDGTLSPFACGFRQPNGLGIDPSGRLFAADNQGDWVGSSKLHHVQEGRFYGHAPSLVWRDDYKKGRTVEQLDRMRTEGAVIFPHAIMANSPGQPVFDETAGKFGPFAGQMFVTEFNIPRVMRVMLEEVHGELQGAATPFYDGPPLRAGSHRLAFAPDGSLWVAQSERKQGWPGGAGIQRISWKGKVPLDVKEVHLTDTGFELAFTAGLDPNSATAPGAIKARRYYYQYHEVYGSPQTDVHDVVLSQLAVARDGKRLKFDVDTLAPGFIYEFALQGVKGADGSKVLNPLVCYTANRLLDGSKAAVPRPPPTGLTQGSGKDKPKIAPE
jgi:glucose/arabinose dehydrogenase